MMNVKLPLTFTPMPVHEGDVGSQAQSALIKHQETRWGQTRGQTGDLKVGELSVSPARSVFARLSAWEWDTHDSTKKSQRRVHGPHGSQLCVGMLVCICENFTHTHKHRHAAMWNASLPAAWPPPRCQVAVGVPVCDPGISVFVLCHSPSLWGDDSPAVPEGMKPEIVRA